MEFVYVLINDNDWENMVIFLSEKEAIASSIKYPNNRIEIFSKNYNNEYLPTYNYIKNGIFYKAP